MSSKDLAQQILEFLQTEGYQPAQIEELAKVMGIARAEFGDFHDACKALMKTGRVALGGGQALMIAEPPGILTGTYRGNPRGFGFVVPHTPNAHGDLYVPSSKTGGAITGDIVRARVQKRGKRQGRMLHQGKIEEIIKRGQSRFAGRLARQLSRWYVIPDGNTLHVPIVVDDPTAKRASHDDSVVVEIIQYPDEGVEARGVIVKVLGPYGEPGVDTLSIIEQYQLPREFPEDVLEAARTAVAGYVPQKAVADREDLRKETIITIDPDDAKDFDDAISIHEEKDGSITLGVHVADVASFVPPGGPLDREARERSTSVYLPGVVIPMLPEVLSNGVCSLQERQVRLTRSAFITYDKKGKVKRERVTNSVIKSTKRLTYRQADQILSGKPGRTSAKVVALLQKMEELAKSIHRRRVREGMLELDLPDVELVTDEKGAVTDAVPADQSFPHKIIEMFMVEANEAVARTLTAAGFSLLRRIHGEPVEDASAGCRKLLAVLGYELPDDADRHEVQRLLARVKGKPEAFTVNLSVLRTMQQAEYSPADVGHYALASEDYCHFTSPIRRYPDLIVHRLVDGLIRKSLAPDSEDAPSKKELYELGRHCSNGERHAEAAERELREVLVLRLMEQHVGDVFEGVVTGVANVGLFVQLQRYLVEGLVNFSHLGDDWWEVDTSRGLVEGERSGHRVTIGDPFPVVVTAVHVPNRRLELAPAEPLAPGKKPGKSRQGGQKAKTGKRRTAKRPSNGRRGRQGRNRRARR
ncbi:MAG: ribonuclease R [Planctomycetota bacterium]|jgi:ribonuclease R